MKVSIITINRNNATGLQKTIESVIAQKFTDFEYIIVDGASTDGSAELIKRYADVPHAFPLTWVSEPDTGIFNAMNKGIGMARGEYLQFLNSGDWLYGDDVLAEVFALNQVEDILYGPVVHYYDENRQRIDDYPHRLTFASFYKWCISHQGSFIKRSLFENSLYNEDNQIISDWEFFVEKIIFENCSTAYIDRCLVYYDMHGISESGDEQILRIHEQERERYLQKRFPPRILEDYETLRQLRSLSSSSIYPYVQVVCAYPKLRFIAKKLLGALIVLAGKRNELNIRRGRKDNG